MSPLSLHFTHLFLKQQSMWIVSIESNPFKQTRREKVDVRIYPKIGMHSYVRRWTGQYVAYDALLMMHSDGWWHDACLPMVPQWSEIENSIRKLYDYSKTCFVQLNLHETDLLFWYLSHHLTWQCSSISEDLHRFARNLQHLQQ